MSERKAAERPRSEPASPKGARVEQAGGGPPQDPLIGPTGKFAGLIYTRSGARIEGTVAGEIVARGKVVIGESGRVRARIEADELVIAGELQGEAWARERIELAPTARVNADLHAPRLALADGCLLEGSCRTEAGEPEAACERVKAQGSP